MEFSDDQHLVCYTQNSFDNKAYTYISAVQLSAAYHPQTNYSKKPNQVYRFVDCRGALFSGYFQLLERLDVMLILFMAATLE